MIHAFSIVASRIGAAGYKLMRSSHETWTSSQDPLTTREPKNRKTGNAQPTKTALTATGPYKRTFEHSAANVRRSRLVLIEDESDLVLDGHVLTAVSRQVVVNGEPGTFAFDADVHGRGMLRHVRIVEGADVDPQPFLYDPLRLVILSASAASDLDLSDSRALSDQIDSV